MSGNVKIVAVLCVLGLVTGFVVSGCSKPAEKPVKDPNAQVAPVKGSTPTAEAPKGEAPKAEEPKPAAPEKPMKPGAPEPAIIHKCAAAPVIDGDLSDACWKNAEVKGIWADIRTGKAADPQPKAFCCYDDRNLYVAFLNPEPNMDQIVAVVAERDGTVYEDDSNEVFLDPTAGKTIYLQFVVNTKGVIYDGKGKDADWNGNEKAAVKKMDKSWSLEISIPLADLGVEGSPKGQTWTANFCRNRLTGGDSEAIGWSDTGASFHNPSAFGKLKFE
jgi:hypothetical protein